MNNHRSNLPPNGIILNIKITPKSSRNEIIGLENDVLKIKIAAQPEKGAANYAIIDFLADKLHTAKGNIDIIQGHTSRLKKVLIKNVPLEKIQQLYVS